MEVIFLGTGTSTGVPSINCKNKKLDLKNPKNWRTRSSIHVIMDGYNVQVDASQEFRIQCLKNKVTEINTFILTHGHADHILGMDDLRSFCQEGALPVFSTQEGIERVKNVFPYAILSKPKYRTYPAFELSPMPSKLETPGGDILSFLLPHGDLETLGLVFIEKSTQKKFSYFCDCKEVTPEAIESAKGSKIIALDGLRENPSHPTHMTVGEAISVAEKIQPAATYLTHLSGEINHETVQPKLPKGVCLAYDGLVVKF